MSVARLTDSPEAVCWPIRLIEDPKVKNSNADQWSLGLARKERSHDKHRT